MVYLFIYFLVLLRLADAEETDISAAVWFGKNFTLLFKLFTKQAELSIVQ